MTPKQYLKLIQSMILSYGGIIKEQKNEFRPPTYSMLTILGEMQITPYDDFIAIRFVGDLTLAQSYFGKTSMDFGFHNGKWNIQGVQRKGKTASEYRETMFKLLTCKLKEIVNILPIHLQDQHV